jgi:uncharacterized protein (TIGR02271 family)
MATLEDVKTWRGKDVVDNDGDKIGTLEDIYLDRQSGEPEWAAIRTGLFGTKVSFAPIGGAAPAGDEIRIPFEKSQVKDAPNVEADGELSPEEEQRLYEHYGRGDYGDWNDTSQDRTEGHLGRDERFSSGHGETAGTTGVAGTTGDVDTDRDRDRDWDAEGRGKDFEHGGPVGRDTSGPTTDEAMTRSEEEVAVGTTQRETGRARLRKYVVTENVQQTVPVQREEVRVEREPITDANVGNAMDGPELSEEEHEVTLRSEEPVVEKRTVPKERVRLDKDTVTDERTVDEEVRKERIEAEGDAENRF